jgi:hypothetical protein
MVLFLSNNLRGKTLIKKLIILLLMTLIFTGIIYSQSDENDEYIGTVAYTQGEQLFSLNAGAVFPLFTLNLSPAAAEPAVVALDAVKVGVAGALKWGTFVADNLLVGAELSGMFSLTANRTLSMVPLSATAAYYFLAYPFEFPVYLNAGLSFNSLGDYFVVTPSVKPGFGAYWNMDGEWAFGLNFDYWFMPDIYFNEEFADQSRIGNFLQISLSAVYHF